MPFPYLSHQIQEITIARKQIRGEKLTFENCGTTGKRAEVNLDLTAGALVNLRWIVIAGRTDDPKTYRASLVLEGERIRGIDFSPVSRKRRYKEAIPKGWHQNVIDPNLPTADEDRDRHVGLADFAVTDLQDFVQKVAKLWHIELEKELVLL